MPRLFGVICLIACCIYVSICTFSASLKIAFSNRNSTEAFSHTLIFIYFTFSKSQISYLYLYLYLYMNTLKAFTFYELFGPKFIWQVPCRQSFQYHHYSKPQWRTTYYVPKNKPSLYPWANYLVSVPPDIITVYRWKAN